MITSAALSLLMSYVTNIVLPGMEGGNIIVQMPSLSSVALLLLSVDTEEEGGFVVWMVADHGGSLWVYHRPIFLSLLGMEGGGGSFQILPIV